MQQEYKTVLEEIISSMNSVGRTIFPHRKGCSWTLSPKIVNSKGIKDLNLRFKTIKFLEKYVEKWLLTLFSATISWYMHLEHRP